MIFVLFFSLFSTIRGDCLEFFNQSIINTCFLREIQNTNLGIDHYYPFCLQCTIETFIKPEDIQLFHDEKCSSIKLQCIQIFFTHLDYFEDFFPSHQQLIYDLFNQTDGISQNTLHIIIKENTLEEIRKDYIEQRFQEKYQSYRVLFFQLYLQQKTIDIDRNLILLTRLPMKIILYCRDDDTNTRQTVYVIYNSNITVENNDDFCASLFNSSSKFITSTLMTDPILSTSEVAVSLSKQKSKDIILIILFLTAILSSIGLTLGWYCYKRLKRYYRRVSNQLGTTSESSSISEEVTPNEQSETVIPKSKRTGRGIHALQLLDDDV